MPGNPFILTTPGEMLEKAKHDLDRLRSEPNAYTAFDFFVTTYHIMDYVKGLRSVNQGAIDAMYADADFEICQSICNRGKHLIVRGKYNKPVSVENTTGAVLGSMGLGSAGAGLGSAPRWRLLCEGRDVEAVQVGERLIARWEQFFKDNGLA